MPCPQEEVPGQVELRSGGPSEALRRGRVQRQEVPLVEQAWEEEVLQPARVRGQEVLLLGQVQEQEVPREEVLRQELRQVLRQARVRGRESQSEPGRQPGREQESRAILGLR